MTFDPLSVLDELELVNAGRRRGQTLDIVQALVGPPELSLTTDGASTLKLTVADHQRKLLRYPFLNERSWAAVAGVHFELVALSKSGHNLTLTFEDAIVAALRRRTKPLSVPAGTVTRRQFTIRLAREAGVPYLVDPTPRPKVRTALKRSAGGKKTNSWEILGSDIAEPIRWRRFSNGKQLIVGGDDWLTTRVSPIPMREGVAGVQSLDFDLDVGKRASTAKAVVDAKLFSVLPGHPAVLGDVGPANGLWVVSGVTRKLTSPRADVDLIRGSHALAEPKPKRDTKDRNGKRDRGDNDYVPGRGGKDGGGRSGNAARERMVNFALRQKGKPYVWGGSGPNGYDCSGLVQEATRAGGNTLGKPSRSQWQTCVSRGKTIGVRDALHTRGALLFRIGVGDYDHVAISLGDGQHTVEAMGSAYGCGVFGGANTRTWTGGAIWL